MIRVDPHELECFLTLAEELHFGRTAQRLRLSPSRVSQLVRSLERRIGGPLFVRTSRRVRLTPVGEQLRADLVPAWRGAHSALLRARQTGSGGSTLTVGQQGTGANELTGEILREFDRLCPGWQVRLVELDFSNQFSALRTGTVDVALARLPVHEPDLTVGAVVVREPRALAVWRDHPLATRDRVGLSEIAGEYIFDLPDTAPATGATSTPRRSPRTGCRCPAGRWSPPPSRCCRWSAPGRGSARWWSACAATTPARTSPTSRSRTCRTRRWRWSGSPGTGARRCPRSLRR